MPAIAMMLSGSVTGGGTPLQKTLTIDHTKVGGSTHTDFTVRVAGTYTYLKTVGNGGDVQNANGYDVGFYSDSGLTTQLSWETEKYTASTGEVIYWVKVPSISHTVDTVIYMGYGDAGITTDQSDPTNAWDSHFKRVFHTPDGTTLSAADSTGISSGTANSLTASAGGMGGSAGGAASWASGGTRDITSSGAAVTTFPLTMSCWAKFPIPLAPDTVLVSVCKTSALEEFWMSITSLGSVMRVVEQGSGAAGAMQVSCNTVDTNWHLYHAAYPNSTIANLLGYQDGAQLGSPSAGGSPASPTGLTDTYVGVVAYNTSSRYGQMQGDIAEVRISDVVRSPDWILAEYNSQSSPSTFYSLT